MKFKKKKNIHFRNEERNEESIIKEKKNPKVYKNKMNEFRGR